MAYAQCIKAELLTAKSPLCFASYTSSQDKSLTVNHNMQAIKKAKFGISLHDFGTGHSSLLYLKRWAVNEVRIDPTFVNDLAKSDEDRAIVRAMVALG